MEFMKFTIMFCHSVRSTDFRRNILESCFSCFMIARRNLTVLLCSISIERLQCCLQLDEGNYVLKKT